MLKTAALLAVFVAGLPTASSFAAENWLPPEVALRDRGDGVVFTDRDGHTLYRFDMDVKPGESKCTDACATAWPPLAAQPSEAGQGAWSVIHRTDGSLQWAFDGKPVYRCGRDERAGDENCEAGAKKFINIWHVIFQPMPTPPGIRLQATPVGWVFADARGMTLYDAPKSKAPDVVPYEAPELVTGKHGNWSVSTRDDGRRQWTFMGKPVFTALGDRMPGDVSGLAKGAVPLVVRPVPLPPTVTVRKTEDGWLYADRRGHTLYLFDDKDPLVPGVCDTACLAANWAPLEAPPAKQAPALWEWRKGPAGREQWFYRGRAVYTFNDDKKPGDIWGQQFGDIVGPGGPWTFAEPPI